MFIDYLPLLLINMAAGLFLLSLYVYKGQKDLDYRKWAAGFLMTAVVALIGGWHLTLSWPLPGSYNVAYGETSVLFGILFFGAGLSLVLKWELFSVAVYGFFAGVASILIGVRIFNLGLTKEPLLSALGFVLSGTAGVLAVFVIWLKNKRSFRFLVAVILMAAAVIWARTGYKAYWDHLNGFSQWVPRTMR